VTANETAQTARTQATDPARAGVAPAAPGAAPAPGTVPAPAPAAAPQDAAAAAAGPASTEVRRAQFQPLQPGGGVEGRDNIGLLMDVVVTMTVVLGGASVPLRDALKLGPGSVVRLERALGEPVDILINKELVGRGEVVVVDDRFGIRVTELLDPTGEKK
jgi:flagellar motor switch protein FliN/FliY